MRLLKGQQQNNNIVTNYFLLQGNNSSTRNKVYICITLIYVNPIQNMRLFTGTKTYFIEIITCLRTLTFLFEWITKYFIVWLIRYFISNEIWKSIISIVKHSLVRLIDNIFVKYNFSLLFS